jgi:hypothetical protein
MELVIRHKDAYNQTFHLTPVPRPWLNIHMAAASASLAAGAVAYTISHVSGTAATAVATNTVSIGGSLLSLGVRLVAGDSVGSKVQSAVQTASYLVQQSGIAATQVGALAASTVTAVGVGAACMIGSTFMNIYNRPRISDLPTPIVVPFEQKEEEEFILYEVGSEQKVLGVGELQIENDGVE